MKFYSRKLHSVLNIQKVTPLGRVGRIGGPLLINRDYIESKIINRIKTLKINNMIQISFSIIRAL